jgi:hypothetical protein
MKYIGSKNLYEKGIKKALKRVIRDYSIDIFLNIPKSNLPIFSSAPRRTGVSRQQ